MSKNDQEMTKNDFLAVFGFVCNWGMFSRAHPERERKIVMTLKEIDARNHLAKFQAFYGFHSQKRR